MVFLRLNLLLIVMQMRSKLQILTLKVCHVLIIELDENNSQVTRRGRFMTCRVVVIVKKEVTTKLVVRNNLFQSHLSPQDHLRAQVDLIMQAMLLLEVVVEDQEVVAEDLEVVAAVKKEVGEDQEVVEELNKGI